MISVTAAMRRAVRSFGELAAAATPTESRTFDECWNRGVRLANHLADRGLQPGDRVAVLEQNSLESVDVLLGAAIGGFPMVPLFWRDSEESHRYMIENTAARALVVAGAADEADRLYRSSRSLDVIVDRDGEYDALLATASDIDPHVDPDVDDVYLIRFSSGTTGRPKGVTYSHRAWMSTLRDWTYGLPPIVPTDTCLHIGPISHGSGYLFLPTFLHGGRNLLLKSFDARKVVATLAEESVGYLFTVPTILRELSDATQNEQHDLASLKAIVVAGAPLLEKVALRARKAFGPRVYQLYGQSEAGPITWVSPHEYFEGERVARPGSVGRPGPWQQIEIRDEEGEVLGANEVGEVTAQVDGHMSWYWNDAERTAERLVDGWMRTGDIGYLDEQGHLFLVDRKDDLIISGGFNIWPAELERVISELDGVVEVAVVGIPDERWGESPLAMCTLVEGTHLTKQEVIDVCVRELGSYKKPSEVILTYDFLPRNPVGKVMRRGVRDDFLARKAAAALRPRGASESVGEASST